MQTRVLKSEIVTNIDVNTGCLVKILNPAVNASRVSSIHVVQVKAVKSSKMLLLSDGVNSVDALVNIHHDICEGVIVKCDLGYWRDTINNRTYLTVFSLQVVGGVRDVPEVVYYKK